MSDKEKEKKKTYKEINGTTRVGDFLRGIKGVAPDILDIAGDITGIDGLKRLSDKIEGTTTISDLDKEIALKKIELDMHDAQMEIEREREITKRWEADMHADSWLSKNVRPLTLVFLLLASVSILIVDAANPNFNVEDYWVSLLSSLTITALGGYFALREIGKFVNLNQKK